SIVQDSTKNSLINVQAFNLIKEHLYGLARYQPGLRNNAPVGDRKFSRPVLDPCRKKQEKSEAQEREKENANDNEWSERPFAYARPVSEGLFGHQVAVDV